MLKIRKQYKHCIDLYSRDNISYCPNVSKLAIENTENTIRHVLRSFSHIFTLIFRCDDFVIGDVHFCHRRFQ